MSRLNLPNGDWADFESRLSYAQARRIRAAVGTDDAQGTFVAALVKAWALRDSDDQPIEFPAREDDGIPLDALNRIPFDSFILMAGHAAESLENIPDPKGTGGTSPSSRQASRSASRRTSPTPTSSNGIQGGLGTISDPPLPM